MSNFREMQHVLGLCSTIPYNSCTDGLQGEYRRYRTWGTDCFGFSELVKSQVPGSVEVYGTYNSGIAHNVVHSAILVPRKSVFYLDPFLRMAEPLELTANTTAHAPTYYADTSVFGTMHNGAAFLEIAMKKRGRTIHHYQYNLDPNNQKALGNVRQNHGYRFAYVDSGEKVTINKTKTNRDTKTTEIEVCGDSPEGADAYLKKNLGITLNQVAEMFFYAGQSAGLLDWLSQLTHRG